MAVVPPCSYTTGKPATNHQKHNHVNIIFPTADDHGAAVKPSCISSIRPASPDLWNTDDIELNDFIHSTLGDLHLHSICCANSPTSLNDFVQNIGVPDAFACDPCDMQESSAISIHSLRSCIRVCQHLPSQIVFLHPPPQPDPSEVVQMLGLQPAPIANHCLPLASPVDAENHQVAYALNTVEQIPQLVTIIPTDHAEHQINYHAQSPQLRHADLFSDFSLSYPGSGSPTLVPCPESMNTNTGPSSEFAAAMESLSVQAVKSRSVLSTTCLSKDPDRTVRLESDAAPPINLSMTEATMPPAIRSFNGLQDNILGSHDANGDKLAVKDTRKTHQLQEKLGGTSNVKEQSRRRAGLPVPHPLKGPTSTRSTTAGEDNVGKNHRSAEQEVMNPMYDGDRVLIRVKTQEPNTYDGFEWKKYGEKIIKKDDFTRSYFKCVETRNGCKALKRTQRCTKNEDYVDFVYLGRHNHP